MAKTQPKLSRFEKKCRQSFCFFLRVIWKHLNLPDPTPVQLEIANYLQYGPKRSIIEAFRGVGKSWITSAYVCWQLLRDPQQKILVVSASKQRADDFTTFTLRLIKEVPVLKHLTPRTDQRESKVAFDVAPTQAAHAASVKSAGIMGQLAGSRADVIVADDIEVPNNSATDDMREKLVAAVSEFNAIIMPDTAAKKPKIVFLGTPQTEESIYNKLRDRGYEARIWPSRYPNRKVIDGYRGALAPTIMSLLEKSPSMEGQPTDPQRFDDMDLIERQASYGNSGFALQFMLDTSLSDAERYPLKHSDLVVMDLNVNKAPSAIQYGSAREQHIVDDIKIKNIGFAGDRWYKPMWYDDEHYVDYEGCVMAIDPSGRGTDETGYAVIAHLHGMLFLLASGGLKGGYTDEVLEELANIAKNNKVKHVVIESNFGDGMFTKIIDPVFAKIYPVTIEEVRHNKQKELRIIDTLEPVMNQHRLIVNKQVVKDDLAALFTNAEQNQKYSLFYQLTRICKDRGALKHDDRLDSVAQGVAYWTESMARSEDKAAKAHAERLLEEELRKHIEGCTGKKIGSNDGFCRRFGRSK